MTVRAKTALAKALAKPGISKLVVRSTTVGELQIQVTVGGKTETIFLKSTPVDLFTVAKASDWRKSSSLLDAVRLGHVAIVE